ncbi:MAG: SRPBCC family protein [Blastococcus sp.]
MTTLLSRHLEGATRAVVDAPAPEVFAALTDVERLPGWNAHIPRVIEAPAGPLAEGVEWVVQMAAMGTTWPSRARVSLFDPGAYRFEHVSRSDDGNPSWADWRWQVTPLPDGRSEVSVAWALNPRTFWRRLLFSKIRRSQLDDEVPTSLDALARTVSAQPAAG